MNFRNALIIALVVTLISPDIANASEEEKGSPISIGADLVNRYIWRGLDFGNSPAIQPGLELNLGGFYMGVWGSYAFLSTPSGIEADLYAGYSFDFGLSAGVTDYYFPGEALILDTSNFTIAPDRKGKYFDYSNRHGFELNLGQEIGDLSFSVNWFFSDNMNNDIYLEATYSVFPFLNVFMGAGNESYTYDGSFQVTNIGISSSKDIQVTESFSLPISASVILNPNLEQLHIVFGFSF